MKKLFQILLIILFFMNSAMAADLVATVTKEDISVPADGSAGFIVSIKNNQIRDDTVQLKINEFALAPFSDVIERVSYDPGSQVAIPSNGNTDVRVVLKISKDANANKNYITNLEIKSLLNPGVKTSVGLSTYVISPREIVSIELDLPETLTPGRKETATLHLRNNANENLDNLDLLYTSSIFNFEDKVSLGPFAEKDVNFDLEISSTTEPGKYPMTVRLYSGGDIKGSANFDILVGNNPDLKESQDIQHGFLNSIIEIVVENKGNTEVSKTVKYPISPSLEFFTKTRPAGETVVSDEGKFYVWSFSVPPGEVFRIEIETDYRTPFFVVVIALLLVGLVLYLQKKNLKIRKTIFKVHVGKESSEFKIMLHVKNVANKELYHVKVIDLLPRFIKADAEFGTLHPSKIQEGSAGMRLVWEIDKIEPDEERLITYKIKSDLSFIGKLELPGAVVQYYGKKKQIVNVRSNRLIYRI